MSVVRVAAFCALAGVSALAAGADGIVLAPGKTVAVIDAGDPLIRVMVTAPADQPLDLTPLLYSVGPRDSVYSIVTRLQVNEAAGLVENADGSLSLGAGPAAVLPAATITGGVIVVLERGRYTHHDYDAPAPTAARPADDVARKKDEVPVLGRIGAPGPAQPAAAAGPVALPTAITLPAGGTISVGSLTPTTGSTALNFSSFNIGSGGSVTLSQPSATSTSLNAVTTGQGQVFGRITGGNISVK